MYENFKSNIKIRNSILYLLIFIIIFVIYSLLSIKNPIDDWDTTYYINSLINHSQKSDIPYFWSYLPAIIPSILMTFSHILLSPFIIEPIYVLNILISFFGALTIILFYLTLKIEVNKLISILGSLFLFVNHTFILTIRAGENNIISSFFMLLFFYYCLNLKNSAGNLKEWVFLGVITAILLTSHSQNVLFLPLIIGLIFISYNKLNSPKTTILAFLISLLTSIIFILSIFMQLTVIFKKYSIKWDSIVSNYFGIGFNYYEKDFGFFLLIRDDFTLKFWIDMNINEFYKKVFGEESHSLFSASSNMLIYLITLFWVTLVIFLALLYFNTLLKDKNFHDLKFYLVLCLVIILNLLFISVFETWNSERWINFIIISIFTLLVIVHNINKNIDLVIVWISSKINVSEVKISKILKIITIITLAFPILANVGDLLVLIT